VASSGHDPVASFVQERMQPASAAFVVQSPMLRGRPADATLEVRPPSITPEALRRELEAALGSSAAGAAAAVRVANRMTATLVTDAECDIVARDPIEQAIDLATGATWRWTLTPKQRGTLRATVTLAALVVIDGDATPYRVTSFERTVTVDVTRGDVLSDILDWFKDYYAAVAAAAGGAVAGLVWLRKRLRRRLGRARRSGVST
jgi:hypothetical protein